MNARTIVLGEELARYETHADWLLAMSSGRPKRSGVPLMMQMSIDARGRVCLIIDHFIRARDEDAYPVTDFYIEPGPLGLRTCRVCGCTDADCRQCVQKTGKPCHWVEADLCSACVPEPQHQPEDMRA